MSLVVESVVLIVAVNARVVANELRVVNAAVVAGVIENDEV